MGKNLIVKDTGIGGAESRTLTTRNIAGRLLEIMAQHIGYDLCISRRKLFEKLYGHEEEDTLKDWLRWEFCRRAMHYCRQNTKCFIASSQAKGKYSYFVLKENSDAMLFADVLSTNIKQLEEMKKRAFKSVREKWWDSTWQLPTRKQIRG